MGESGIPLAFVNLSGGITADTTPEEACEIMIAEMQKLTIEGLTGTMTWSATGEVSKLSLIHI